jgi:hypothetical protein
MRFFSHISAVLLSASFLISCSEDSRKDDEKPMVIIFLMEDSGYSGISDEGHKQSSATVDFMFGADNREPCNLKKGEKLEIQFFAYNEDQTNKITLYPGFEKIETDITPIFSFSIHPDQPGSYTINPEFLSKSGIFKEIHGDIPVVDGMLIFANEI